MCIRDRLLYGKGEMIASVEDASIVSSSGDYQPSLFDENPVNSSKEPFNPENRKEMPLRSTEKMCIRDSGTSVSVYPISEYGGVRRLYRSTYWKGQ